jgi:hypothetical protein
LCKKIALDVTESTGIELDKGIYCLGKSLRIPGCVNIKEGKGIIQNSILKCPIKYDKATWPFTMSQKECEKKPIKSAPFWFN